MASASPTRIITVDYLKGIAVIWFCLGHMMLYWRDDSWESLAALCIICLDWLTVTFFITTTVLGTMMSIYRKQETGTKRGMFRAAIVKASFLLIVGEGINLTIDLSYQYNWGAWHVFGANMISVIALSQLLTYGLVRLGLKARMILAAMLSVLYFILLKFSLDWLGYDGSGFLPVYGPDLANPAYVFYFLVFFMDSMAPTMTWLIVATLASIIFDKFSRNQASSDEKTSIPRRGGKQSIETTSGGRTLLVPGCTLVLLGMLAGGLILFRGIGPSALLYDYITNDDPFRFYLLEGLPLVLTRHVPQYALFNVGLLAIVFEMLYARERKPGTRFPFQEPVARAGKYSLTIFVAQHVLALFPLKIPLYMYVIIAIPVVFIIIIGIREWETRANAKGTLEWLLPMYTYKLSHLGQMRLEKQHA